MTSPCGQEAGTLTFETLLNDPMIRLVMESDGVSLQDLVNVLETARAAIVARVTAALTRAIGT